MKAVLPLWVVMTAAFAIGTTGALTAQACATAAPAPAEAPPVRFTYTDYSAIGDHTAAYLVRDRQTPGQCLLVVMSAQFRMEAVAMTSQPWPCGAP